MSNKFKIIVVLLFAIFIYFLLCLFINKHIFGISNFPYYTDLVKSLLNGKLNVISPNHFEQSFFNGKWYLYWGPAPVLFILPFFLIFGSATSDILYTLAAGVLNIILFYFLTEEFVKHFKLRVALFDKFLVILSFAFASPNLSLSVVGQIWPTSQVISILYLIIFYLFYFKFLNNPKNIKYLLVGVLFLNLAWFSRLTLIINFISLIYLFVLVFNKYREKFKLVIFSTVAISTVFVTLFMGYNYLRFGNPLDSGLRYVRGNPRYEYAEKNKIFSLSYVSHNINYYFLNHASFLLPADGNKFPIVILNLEGNSAISVYPLLIFALLLFQGKYLRDKKINKFLLAALAICGVSIIMLMLYFSTGATQFGSRFFFDIIPLIFLLTLFVLKDIPKVFKYIVLFYGFIINFLGTIIFYSLFR